MSYYNQRDDPYEREPLDSHDDSYDTPPRRPAPSSHGYYQQPASPYYDGPSRHQDDSSSSSSNRTRGQDYGGYNDYSHPSPRHGRSAGAPVPPPHADNTFSRNEPPQPALPPDAARAAQGDRNARYQNPQQSSTITPGADNFSDSASGGMAGIAYSVAERNARESGVEAMRGAGQVPPPPSRAQYPNMPRQTLSHQASGGGYRYDHSAYGVGSSSAASRSSSRAPHSLGGDPYADDPYQGYSSGSRNGVANLGIVNPNDIEDDGDDGLHYPRNSQRNSMLSSNHSDRGARPAFGAAAAVGGAAGAGAAMGGLLGRNAYPGGGDYDPNAGQEKSKSWFATKEGGRSKRFKLTVIILIFIVVIGALVGGVVGGVYGNYHHGGSEKGVTSSDGKSAEQDTKDNGDLNINSAEIKALLNNPDLHKVFPGMDYTPINTQYPDCLKNPPSQNNVTRDVAVLSQLTNRIRLYGTDCNQTQMLVHAIDQLDMKNDIKIWLGVWQDGNTTTNKRQLTQMWEILDDFGDAPFEGIIVANEIIFREEMTVTALGSLLDDVRSNLSDHNLDLQVATSDLGDDWTTALADDSDYLMANIHPFFAGVEAVDAAAWTYNFWDTKDRQFFKKDKSKNIISETGWPSAGGKDCGGATTCTQGSVAGIDEMNQYMNDWVCQALENGTNYFWFEAFDEPWKITYDTKGKNWEDKWGLMDVDRNLKKGVKIPDCGGKTIS